MVVSLRRAAASASAGLRVMAKMMAPLSALIWVSVTSGAMWAWQSSGGRSDGDTSEFLQSSVAEGEYGVEVGVGWPESGGDDAVLVEACLGGVGPGGDVVAA